MITDEEFIACIRASKLTISELANAVSVSQPTIRRWRSGMNLPHQAVRESILKFLKAALSAIG